MTAPGAWATLRTWWPDKSISTTEIGLRLGTTKNAVCGMADRLELPARTKPRAARDSDWHPDQEALLRELRHTFKWRVVANRIGRSQGACQRKSHDLDVRDRLAALNGTSVAAVTRPAFAVPSEPAEPPPAPRTRAVPVAPPRHAEPPIPRIVPRLVFTAPVRPVAHLVPRYTGKVEPCCWVTTEGGKGKPWLYCDASSLPGKPYCGEHTALSVQVRR